MVTYISFVSLEKALLWSYFTFVQRVTFLSLCCVLILNSEPTVAVFAGCFVSSLMIKRSCLLC